MLTRSPNARPVPRHGRDATVSADADAGVGYAEALGELDAILRELEGSDVDVDRLADRVARAADLIALCRDRIAAARLRIDEVIADLDTPMRIRVIAATTVGTCPRAVSSRR